MHCRLRPAKATDISAIRHIDELASQKFSDIPHLSDLASSAVEEGGIDESTVREWLEKGGIYIAERKESTEPVGFIAFQQLEGGPVSSSTYYYIAELGVVSEHQGKGVGSRLVRAVLHPLEARPASDTAAARRVALMTFADVPWNMPWYLNKFGFREIAEEDVAGTLGQEMAKILREDKAKLERPGWRRCCLLWGE